MKPAPIRATPVERTFGREEIIVSKTDPLGRITYANDVFQRVSGFSRDELMGKPHSIIRHPDMPRAVFKLLWDTVQAGDEIFAYVKNLAADGSYYWVLAHVTPSRVGGRIVGFHSNRRLPDPGALREVEALYALLLAEERRHPTGNKAVAASCALLLSMLAERGVSYEEFVWDIINRHQAVR